MTSAKRAVLTLRSFTLVGIPQQREAVRSLGFWRARSGGCRTPYLKKSAREPRQGGSDYRCCIPALAGFVSPRSIAPDGEEKFAQDRHRAIGFWKSKVRRAFTGARFWLLRPREMVGVAFARSSSALVHDSRESARSL